MGIGITSKRPALFTVTQQNNTEVVANTRGLWGMGKMPKFALGAGGKRSGQVVFQIPYDRIIEVTRADFMANKALWIRYQADGGEKGVGITAGLMHHQQLLIWRNYCKPRWPAERAEDPAGKVDASYRDGCLGQRSGGVTPYLFIEPLPGTTLALWEQLILPIPTQSFV